LAEIYVGNPTLLESGMRRFAWQIAELALW